MLRTVTLLARWALLVVSLALPLVLSVTLPLVGARLLERLRRLGLGGLLGLGGRRQHPVVPATGVPRRLRRSGRC